MKSNLPAFLQRRVPFTRIDTREQTGLSSRAPLFVAPREGCYGTQGLLVFPCETPSVSGNMTKEASVVEKSHVQVTSYSAVVSEVIMFLNDCDMYLLVSPGVSQQFLRCELRGRLDEKLESAKKIKWAPRFDFFVSRHPSKARQVEICRGTPHASLTPLFRNAPLAAPRCSRSEMPSLPAMDDFATALAPQDAALMRSVSSLRASLDTCFDAVKCVVCQESLSDAQQLECCHALCKQCLDKSMEVMPKVDRGRSPCPVCRFPINKRSIQDAPLPVAQIVAAFERLDFLIADAEQSLHDDKPPPDSMPPAPPTPPRTAAGPVDDVSRPALSPSSSANQKQSPCSTYPVSACAFCPRGVDPATVFRGAEMGPLRPLAAPGATKSTQRVHEECGFFAENVYSRAGNFVNAEKALRKAKKKLCQRDACGRKGATVVCAADNCDARFHYVCALAADCVVLLDGSYSMFCPSHVHLAPRLDMDDFAQHRIDPDGSQAQQSADICLACGKGGELVLCDDCDRACHLVCAGLAAIPRGAWRCGVCTGTLKVPVAEIENQAGAATTLPPPKSETSHRKRKAPRTPSQVLQPLSSNVLRQSEGNGGKTTEKRKAVTYKRRRRSGEGIVVLHTGLSSAQASMFSAARKKHKGAFSVASDFSKRVTHVVVNAYTPQDIPKRTLKLCMGIAANLPIVCFKWVEDAVSNPVLPLPSLSSYLHRTSRVSCGRDGLFHDQRFFMAFKDNNGQVPTKQDITQLIQLGGGTIMTHQPMATAAVQEQGKVFYVKAKEGGSQQNERRLSQHQTALQLPAGCEIIDLDWLLDKCMRPL